MQNNFTDMHLASKLVNEGINALSKSLEEKIIQHCTPTLLGLKQANMFTFQENSPTANQRSCSSSTEIDRIARAIERCNQKLQSFDIEVLVLAHNRCGELLYVFNRDELGKILERPATASYLEKIGYNTSSTDESIQLLSKRIKAYREAVDECGFPHEVGLFLGYPLSDVISFIKHKGQGAICCGCWKVYSNADAAQKYFRVLKKSTEFCKSKLGCGYRLEEIISMGTRQNFSMELAS